MREFSKAQRKKLNKAALAEKHECHVDYVRMVLRGAREDKSEKAKAIISDAEKMLEILEPKDTPNV